MGNNFYMTNRQKLLFMVEALHKLGFGKLRIIPSLSPSGVYWRCSFIDEENKTRTIASNWLLQHEKEDSKEEIKLTMQELSDLFIKENPEFLEHCKGVNEAYGKWYSEMLGQLTENELPYESADWEIPDGIWKTSKGNKIKAFLNE